MDRETFGLRRLFSLLGIVLGIISQSVSQTSSPPQVEISFPDVGDKDFTNGTWAVMSNSNAAFVMECNATYPIEWVFYYSEEDDGTSEKVKIADTHRYANDFTDPRTYKYRAKLRVEYNGKLLVLSNFTCKATESDELRYQTHVYMTEQNRKSVLILEISNEYRGEHLNPSQNTNENENCKHAMTTVAYLRDWRSPCWTCKIPDGNELELDFQSCQTPIECNSVHKRQKRGKQCLQQVPEISKTCKLDGLIEFFPKLILCKNFGPALAQFYFFGVFRGDFEDAVSVGPPIYFDWEDADPSQMLYIHPIKSHVYEGEEVLLKCEYSRYYFSLGSWFGIKNSDGVQYIRAFDMKPCETSAEIVEANTKHNCNITDEARRMGTYVATLKTKFKILGPHEVYCFGPVWNSTEWVNASLAFEVKKGQEPRVLSVTSEKNEPFILGQRNRSLVCHFEGVPKPKITWEGPQVSTVLHENSSSQLKFSEIGYQSSGNYKCTAQSFLGNHSQSFNVKSQPPSVGLSTGGITGIALACMVILAVFSGVMIRMRSIIIRQRKELRLLTEDEIQDFIEGNPDIVKKAKNEYFNNATAIEALPYDTKYEIPVEKLSVDYSFVLGSGEFGIVLKGKVHPENASHYINVAFIPETKDNDKKVDNNAAYTNDDDEAFEVAVKICKKDVDVTNFKALLSEVKVMAYLGQYENIVSLIGASTHNIRNRELLVAVEYCHNGSLDSYMKKNKARFFNKVKYGYYQDAEGENNPEVGGGDSYSYINLNASDHVFSSVELFRWTRDVAKGVEYIHSKRVIHGDLALRNVLITKDLTAKVGDFGLSRQLGDSSSYTKQTKCALPWRNLALESLKQLDFSVKSDMWALGVTLWELFTLGEVPYPGLTYTLDFVREIEEGSLRLSKPPYATNDIYEFMLMCWEKVPADRPSTTEIQVICQRLLNDGS